MTVDLSFQSRSNLIVPFVSATPSSNQSRPFFDELVPTQLFPEAINQLKAVMMMITIYLPPSRRKSCGVAQPFRG